MTTRRLMMTLGLALVLCVAGCGGAGESGGGESRSLAEEEDLTKQWGPDDMPDSSEQPLEFLYWRVDRLYEREDLDSDGRLGQDEYSGDAHNFERIDANGDGFITKKEVIDDFTVVLREQGKIP